MTDDKQLTLRQLFPNDRQDYFDWIDANRAHLIQFGEGLGLIETAEELTAVITPDENQLRFGIWDHQSHTLVGSLFLYKEKETATIDYHVSEAEQGKHIAPRAAAAAVEYAFGTGIKRVNADVHPDNSRSVAVLKRIGFTPEGTKPFTLEKGKPPVMFNSFHIDAPETP